MLKKLLVVAALLVAVVAGSYWYVYGRSKALARPPEVLATESLGNGPLVVRERAAIELADYGERALPQLRQVFRESTVPEVRAAAILGISQAKDWQSVPELLNAMEDESLLVRGRAGAAVRDLIGADYHFRAEDPPEKRAAILSEIRRVYHVMNEAKKRGQLE
jgi:HEAT repeat protein